jgi:hypothetical protein
VGSHFPIKTARASHGADGWGLDACHPLIGGRRAEANRWVGFPIPFAVVGLVQFQHPNSTNGPQTKTKMPKRSLVMSTSESMPVLENNHPRKLAHLKVPSKLYRLSSLSTRKHSKANLMKHSFVVGSPRSTSRPPIPTECYALVIAFEEISSRSVRMQLRCQLIAAAHCIVYGAPADLCPL